MGGSLRSDAKGAYPRVLIVEENEHHSSLMEERLREAYPRASIVRAVNIGDATERLPHSFWDLVVLSSSSRDGHGEKTTELLNRLDSQDPFVAVAILSEEPNGEMLPLVHHGPVEYLKKDRETLEVFVAHCRRMISSMERLRALVVGSGGTLGVAFRDPLTGVYSRAFFEEALAREVSQSRRYAHPFSVLMVDVDRFRKINQEAGPSTGNRCLKRLAGILSHSVRAGDVVSRYGGGQFTILLSQCRREDALRCAGRVLSRVRLEGTDNRFTVSIGVVHHVASKVNRSRQVLRLAHGALGLAKRRGGNRFVVAA